MFMQRKGGHCRILVRIGGEEMLSWGGADPEQTLHALLQAVALLLTPEAGDSASLGIGEVHSPCQGLQTSATFQCPFCQLHHCCSSCQLHHW